MGEERNTRTRDRVGVMSSLLEPVRLPWVATLCVVPSILALPSLTLGNIGNLFWQTATAGIIVFGQTFATLTAGVDLSVGVVAVISAMLAGVIFTHQGIRIG